MVRRSKSSKVVIFENICDFLRLLRVKPPKNSKKSKFRDQQIKKNKISKKSKARDQKVKKSKFSEWSPEVLGRFVWVRSDVKTLSFCCQIEKFGTIEVDWPILKFGKLRLPDQYCVSNGGSGEQRPPQVKRGRLGGQAAPPVNGSSERNLRWQK